eukprot:scaffold41884_cov58-Phaeocystis_antarctica.AAC.6
MHPPLAPSPRIFPSHPLFAPSTRTHSHPPLAPCPDTLPSPIACSWSAPATRSACTSLRSTCRWCPRVSRGYP